MQGHCGGNTLGCLGDREGASASEREGTHGDGQLSAGCCHHDEDSGTHSRGISDGEPSERPATPEGDGASVKVTHPSTPAPHHLSDDRPLCTSFNHPVSHG